MFPPHDSCVVVRGTFIEFRNGMINVSPVGRNCSKEERDSFEVYDLVSPLSRHLGRDNHTIHFIEGTSHSVDDGQRSAREIRSYGTRLLYWFVEQSLCSMEWSHGMMILSRWTD